MKEERTYALTEYIRAAMRQAGYELMENGQFFARIPSCPGLWAEGSTLEECREELQSTLEDWILVKLKFGDEMPVIDGLDLNLHSETDHAEAHQPA